ncbi:MAG: type II secretion system F family protein [Deltaproteobacteria bacterium]|nr:type II secretion system F family protein [Deltaproteobacteria bacterium]
MAVYAYSGVNEKGRSVRGTIDAESEKAVRQVLRKKGIYVEDARPLASNATAGRSRHSLPPSAPGSAKSAKKARGLAALSVLSGVSSTPTFAAIGAVLKKLASSATRHVSVATRQLATLLKAGIQLPEALNAITEQIDHAELRAAFEQVETKVREGISFHKALEEHPQFFEPLYINMIAAGESSGNLDGVLARLADFIEAEVKLKGKITSALAYPAFMAFFGGMIISLLMVVVVPKVAAIFQDFQKALPWYTDLLIKVSGFLGSYWWLIALLMVVGAAVFYRWKRTPEGAYRWDETVLRLPLFGELIKLVAVTRFTRTLATLLASGVQLPPAMEIVKNVLGNRVLEGVVTDANRSIKEGENIADALKRSGKFPKLVVNMIAIGERTGDLESMLVAVSDNYDGIIDARVTLLTSMLEPLMIAAMGGTAAAVAFSILMPLMQLNDFVQ